MESDASRERIAVAFRLLCAADIRSGRVRPLSEYLQRFEGYDDVVAAEYLLVHKEGRPAGGDSGATPEAPPPAEGGGGPAIGPYRLLRELGRGGQAIVWLAEDSRLGRRVALKVMTAFAGTRPDAVSRFGREAEAASRLDHPGVCPVFETGTDGGVPWIAMRYVEGETLAQVFRRATTPDRAATLDFARVVAAAARALHVAHEAGVVHRDVKPGNLMIGTDGSPVVLDFGLARMESAEGPSLTRTGDVFGTPAYMAPEQVRGGMVDRRADVWALGVVLYEGLAGSRPFEAPTRDAQYRAITLDLPPDLRALNPAVPRDLATVVAMCLEKEADRRYATAEVLAQDLIACAGGHSISARPPSVAGRVARWIRRRPAVALSALAFTVFVTAALVVALALLSKVQDERDAKIRALDDVERLADLRALRLLPEWSVRLWPTTGDKIGGPDGMDAWIAAAGRILSARERNATLLEALEEDLPSKTGAARDRDLWLRDGLAELVRGADEFAAPRERMKSRRAWAADVARTTIDDHRDAWREAAAAATLAPYAPGLEVRPIAGLVPLGPDPISKCLEFWQPETGARPARDEMSGRLVIDHATGIVLVLVPGGSFPYGPGLEEPSVFAKARGQKVIELPGHEGGLRSLGPFLMGKYEVTQGQWLRIMGSNPSHYSPGMRSDRTLAHPAENMTWIEALDFARRIGGRLPSDAEWECAARAGTATSWSTGDDELSLDGMGNVADEGSRAGWPPGYPLARGLSDGHAIHASVGTYPPNAFGLHDMIGNVGDLLAESYEYQTSRYIELALTDVRPMTDRIVLYGGGSFSELPVNCRSGARTWRNSDQRAAGTGLRVARDR